MFFKLPIYWGNLPSFSFQCLVLEGWKALVLRLNQDSWTRMNWISLNYKVEISSISAILVANHWRPCSSLWAFGYIRSRSRQNPFNKLIPTLILKRLILNLFTLLLRVFVKFVLTAQNDPVLFGGCLRSASSPKLLDQKFLVQNFWWKLSFRNIQRRHFQRSIFTKTIFMRLLKNSSLAESISTNQQVVWTGSISLPHR